MRTQKSHKEVILLFLVIAVSCSLLLIKTFFFNEFGSDDANMASLSLSILKGNIAIPFLGNFLESSQYFFASPPLHSALTAIVFKLLGVSYLTSKFVSIFFTLIGLIFIAVYCYRTIGFLPALAVTGLTAFDYILFCSAGWNRPDTISVFFATLAAMLLIESEKRGSLRLLFFSGIFSGITILSSYRSIWLFMAFFGYCVYLFVSNGFKDTFKKALVYLLPAAVITIPWFSWIMTDNLRRSIFLMQVSGCTASANGYSIAQIMRSILNPAADLYLAAFRDHSPFPVIVLLLYIYFLRDIKRNIYQFLLLTASLIMLIFNLRGAYNLIAIIPFCYIQFGYTLKSLSGRMKSRLLEKVIYACIGIAVLAGLVYDIRLAFRRPDITLDSKYCGSLLDKYTEDGSRIATDPVFVFADCGDRKTMDIGLLIWDHFRKKYNDYSEMTEKVVDADYIILSERMKKWGELPISQSADFQKYLKEKCTLVKEVDDGFHGPFWIYEAHRPESRSFSSSERNPAPTLRGRDKTDRATSQSGYLR